MPATMRAIRQTGYGGADKLSLDEVPRPEPGPGQVLVRVYAASVNPIDWKLREGMLKDPMPQQFPSGVGEDLAGVVEEVGPGVTDFAPGTAVYAMLAPDALGAYAEYAVVDRAALAVKPSTIDFTTAAAVPMGALTAWQGIVEHASLTAGQRLLVHAAGGNVGGMAVQIAVARGAEVTAVAYADAEARLREWGVTRFIDYRAQPFETVAQQMDVVFDTLAGDVQARSWGVLKRGGILVSTLYIADPDAAAKHGVCGVVMGAQPNGEQLRQVAELVDAGKLRTVVGTTLPLAEAGRAQELSRAGKAEGKIVLTMV